MAEHEDDHYGLLFAISAGDFAKVKIMIRHGFAINYQTVDGYTALYDTVTRGHYDLGEWMIEHGEDPLARADPEELNENLLRYVARTCSANMAKLLLRGGGDPLERGWMNQNSLDVAMQRTDRERDAVVAAIQAHVTSRPKPPHRRS